MANSSNISCSAFTDFLIRYTQYDRDIIKGVQPIDSGFIGMTEAGVWPAFSGVERNFDRIDQVYPDLTGAWEDVVDGSCEGAPCDPSEKKIGFGYTRDTYKLQRKSYATDLFCFDLMMSADRAKEQFAGLIENLRDASKIIVSDRIRTEGLEFAGKKWLASAAMTDFTYTWNTDHTIMTPSALPTSELTPQMLQRRVMPQIMVGALGKTPVGQPISLELITDPETLWALNRDTTIDDFWSFREFDAASAEYWRYGWSGKIGNYMVHPDMFPMRFLKTSTDTLRRVFPFTNVSTTAGIKQQLNTTYLEAQYQISYIWHRRGLKHLTAEMESVNKEMPFATRNLAGTWKFVMDNLGATADGCVIENRRRNKGQFIADFVNGTKAQYPEFIEAILHLREPAVVSVVTTTASAPADAAQTYSSANDACADVLYFTPALGYTNTYEIAANSIMCNGVPIVHNASTGTTTLAGLATDLQSKVSILGAWTIDTTDATRIKLTGSPCPKVEIPFLYD